MNTITSSASHAGHRLSATLALSPVYAEVPHRENSRSPSLFSRWVSLSEAQWIVIEASAGSLCLGGAAVFGLMAPNMPWTALVASTGSGLAAGIAFLAALASYGSFKRLNEIEESATAKTRYLEANVYFWKTRAEELAYSRFSAGAEEVSGAFSASSANVYPFRR